MHNFTSDPAEFTMIAGAIFVFIGIIISMIQYHFDHFCVPLGISVIFIGGFML